MLLHGRSAPPKITRGINFARIVYILHSEFDYSNMNTLRNAFIIVSLIMIIYLLGNHFYLGKEAILASDGEEYYVVGGYENQRGAAELLSNVNRNVMLFLKYLKIKYRVNYTDMESMQYNTAELNRITEEFKNMPGNNRKQSFVGMVNNLTGVSSIKSRISGLFAGLVNVANSVSGSGDSFMTSVGQRHASHYTKPARTVAESLVGSINSTQTANNFSMNAVNRVLSGYDLENIMENDPKAPGDNTYTVDKGARMLVCLRNRETFALHDFHTVMFVVMHELAHIANEKWGHSSESQFWEIFKFLLHEGKVSGMHEPVNYEQHPIRYCGLNVNYSPYFDDSVRKLWLAP